MKGKVSMERIMDCMASLHIRTKVDDSIRMTFGTKEFVEKLMEAI
jgi:hypothetical protein